MFLREVVQILLLHAHACERYGFHWKRLCGRRLLARDLALGHGPLLHAKDRLTREAVIDEEHSHLRVLNDGGNPAAVLIDVDQRGLRSKVVVPNVVMHKLLIPLQLSRIRIQCHDAIRVQIVAGALDARIVRPSLRHRREHHSALCIHRQESPDIRTAWIFPAITGPRFMSGITRLCDQLERPNERARSKIPGSNNRQSATGYCQIFVDCGR